MGGHTVMEIIGLLLLIAFAISMILTTIENILLHRFLRKVLSQCNSGLELAKTQQDFIREIFRHEQRTESTDNSEIPETVSPANI